MDLKSMSVEQKKVLAYDLIALAEQTQRNLQLVNASIAESVKEKPNAGLRTPDIVPPVEKAVEDGTKA